ncbi:hypothetical protein A9K55_002796 [Cordyceps militaris]|uniref:glucan endo-1,3-beta-D-glucosidase n=1 Tax=Cordyceps militaris TaxID=73501 RepID=A0A2H4S9H9_CORMI|nr:hypothetical protein A9K55_002796 [Cordyceps militaris]
MKYTIPLVAMANIATVAGLTQQCTGRAVNEGGNFFCGAVEHIVYKGVGSAGSYQAVKGMTSTGECQKEAKSFSGPLAPLDEGLSLHFRGPIRVKEVAVYTLSAKAKQRRQQGEATEGPAQGAAAAHGHQQFHEAARKKKKRAPAEWVTATINGQVVSWENNWHGGNPTPAPLAAAAAAAAPTVPAAPAAPKPKAKPATSGQAWDRTSYYNAETQQAENLVFLGNHGGQGSGQFDTVWGNSLSYLNAQGTAGASSSQILADVDIPSDKEFSIFSGEPCDESCGFSRAKDVAYKGFEGAHKVFLFKFKMPLDGNRANNNGDMPAIWSLNAHIPRSAQYNACSCWPKCGEFDFFEVLASGDTKCKSTLHLSPGGGSSDYFTRPTDAYIKGAVVFDADAGAVAIRVLPADTDFSKGLDDATVQAWLTGQSPSAGGLVGGLLSSVFELVGGRLSA